MSFLVTMSMIFIFTLTLIFFGKFGKDIDSKKHRIESLGPHRKEEFDESLAAPFTQRFLLPMLGGFLKFFSRMVPKNKHKEVSKLERDLKLAGINIPAQEFSALRLITVFWVIGLIAVVSFFSPIDSTMKLTLMLCGTATVLIASELFLRTKITTRQGNIQNQLPDVLDLLTVSMEAGLGFDAALIKVEEHTEGALVEELAAVHKEIQMGIPRREALMKLGTRSNIPELRTFLGAVVQADQLGLPIKNVLRVQSQQLRLSRKQRAHEKAMKAPVKMLLPLVIFIFPVIFIILLGPAVLQIIKTFGGG